MKSIPSAVWFMGTLVIGALFIGILVLSADQQFRDDIELPIEIVEFFDYRCSHCADAFSEMEKIKADFGDKVEVTPRHFVVIQGSNSYPLAYGAEAARNQDRFMDYHNEAFARSIAYFGGQIETEQVDPFLIAEAIGLDMEEFAIDIESEEVMERVNSDIKLGADMGVTGTPTFFVEGQLVNLVKLDQVVKDLIAIAESK